MGKPFDLLLTSEPEGLGGGCRAGATSGKVGVDRYMLWFRLHTRALELNRNVWASRQLEKISSFWQLSLPGVGESLSNEEFSTSAAISLCVPPPCGVAMRGILSEEGLWWTSIETLFRPQSLK